MNNTDNSLGRIAEIITKGASGIIALPANPSQDALAAATALYLGLTKMGKTVSLACSTTPTAEFTGIDKIQQNLTTGGNNLVISFPYIEGSIDKVDYNIQNNQFNLIIIPRPNYPKLSTDKVNFSYSGGTIDFIITVDAPNLNTLGTIYSENQEFFQGKTIINIDRHLVNNFFGTVNYVQKTSSSTVQIILQVLRAIQCEIDKDMATNMYAGLSAATNNFTSYSVNADTFEAAAALLKAGALKRVINRQSQPQPAREIQQPVREQMPQEQPRRQQFNRPQNNQQNQPQHKQPVREIQQQQPIERVEREELPEELPTPEDWLKPKIFKGSGLI